MKALLLAAALTYQIPLETLDGKTEQLTVEDAQDDGSRFLFCVEVGDDNKRVIGLFCQVEERDGTKYWVTVPAQ